MRLDDLGWLVPAPGDPPVERVPTTRVSPLEQGGPLGLCWHWTAGDYSPDRGHTDSIRLAQSIVDRPPVKGAAPDVIAAAVKKKTLLAAASWHALIDKDGAIIQSASFLEGTWHVGKAGTILGRQRLPNRTLIGIEIENAGRLRSIGGGVYAWPWYENPEAEPELRRPDARFAVDRARAVPAKGGLFDAYTPEQERSAALLVAACVERFRFTREACLFGHRDFDFPRKEDPGPLWSDTVLPRVLAAVFPPA